MRTKLITFVPYPYNFIWHSSLYGFYTITYCTCHIALEYRPLYILFQKIQTLLVNLFIYIFIYFNRIRSKEHFYSGIIQNIC